MKKVYQVVGFVPHEPPIYPYRNVVFASYTEACQKLRQVMVEDYNRFLHERHINGFYNPTDEELFESSWEDQEYNAELYIQELTVTGE